VTERQAQLPQCIDQGYEATLERPYGERSEDVAELIGFSLIGVLLVLEVKVAQLSILKTGHPSGGPRRGVLTLGGGERFDPRMGDGPL
jgi:hypothetical protein